MVLARWWEDGDIAGGGGEDDGDSGSKEVDGVW